MDNSLRNKCFNFYNKKDYQEVINILKPILAEDSEDAEMNHIYGVCLFKVDNIDLALYHINKAVALDNNKEYIINLGNIYLKKGNYNKAIEAFTRLIDNNNDYSTYGIIANAYFEAKDYKNSQKYYKQALEKNNNFMQAYDRLGDIFYHYEKYDEAIDFYQKALNLKPLQENIYYNMGICYKKLKNYPKAIENYLQTIKISKNYHKAYNSLGKIFLNKYEFFKAYRCFKKCIELKPDFFEGQANLASLYVHYGRIEEGLEIYKNILTTNSFKKSIYYLHNNLDTIDGTLADVYLNLSMSQFLLNDFKSAWNNYEFRFYVSDKAKPLKMKINRPFLDGLDVNNKTIFIYLDQGIGDTVFFARYFDQLLKMNNKIILLCQSNLTSLFKHSFPEIEFIDNYKAIENYNIDYHIPIGSLPYLFQRVFQTNILIVDRYIHPDLDRIQYFKETFFNNKKFKIGLCWKGNPEYPKDAQRSMHLEQFINLTQLPNIQLYSLQKENWEEEIDKFSNQLNIINLAQHLNNFMDTASVIENLDLLISVDTSVAHISGAMTKQTLLMLPFVPDWRWTLKGENTPWYKNHSLIRQQELNNWDKALDIMYNEVAIRSNNH